MFLAVFGSGVDASPKLIGGKCGSCQMGWIPKRGLRDRVFMFGGNLVNSVRLDHHHGLSRLGTSLACAVIQSEAGNL